MLVLNGFPQLLADMVSLEVLLISGGVIMLIVGGVFFAVATVIAGFIKRRKLQNESTRERDVRENPPG
ncbi:MAG: hypothetical protein WAO83_20270 [Fuerstiella sp.]